MSRLFQVKLIQHVRADRLKEVVAQYAALEDAEPGLRNVSLTVEEIEDQEEKDE